MASVSGDLVEDNRNDSGVICSPVRASSFADKWPSCVSRSPNSLRSEPNNEVIRISHYHRAAANDVAASSSSEETMNTIDGKARLR